MPELKYRYPGINSFGPEDADIFCGRDEDKQKLYSLIKATNIIVLHGESGIGKSSLVNAGIIPEFKKRDPSFIPVVIKFNNEKKTTNPELLASEHDELLLVKKIIDAIKFT